MKVLAQGKWVGEGRSRFGSVVQTSFAKAENAVKISASLVKREHLTPSGRWMLVAATSLVCAQATLSRTGIVSSEQIPAAQPVQQHWGSSPCREPGDRQQG